MIKAVRWIAFALISFQAIAEPVPVATLSMDDTVYVGENLAELSVLSGGTSHGTEAFDKRYGKQPDLKGSIVPRAITESYILTRPEKSEFVFVYFHGITDSGFQGKDLARALFQQGYNVVVARLSGHGADTPNIGKITRFDWRNDVHRAVDKAKQLGRRVILVGLSTGGLLSLDRAFYRPKDIAAVVAIAPAISIADNTLVFMAKLNLVSPLSRVIENVGEEATEQVTVRQKRKNLHALNELYELGQSLQKKIDKGRKLSVPTLFVTSSADTAIRASWIPKAVNATTTVKWLQLQQADDAAEARIQAEGNKVIVYSAQVPQHSAMVFSPDYVAHSVQPDGSVELPFHALNEVNLHFDLMVREILALTTTL